MLTWANLDIHDDSKETQEFHELDPSLVQMSNP